MTSTSTPSVKSSSLFINPREFFETASHKITPPLLLTLLYAVLSGISATLSASAVELPAGIPAETTQIIGITSGISAGIISIIVWIAVALLFFIFLKLIGHAQCHFKDSLRVCGYVSTILIPEIIITYLISLLGTAHPLSLLLLSAVFLLWSIPIWYCGFKAVNNIPDKKLKTSIAIPIIIMVTITLISTLPQVFI